jgi:hypothetical protein
VIAEVEQPDRTYELVEMGPVKCGTFCDTCGDCLHCYPHDEESWCATGGRWVIYMDDDLNPNRLASNRDSESA